MIINEGELLRLAEKVVRRYIMTGSIPIYEEEDFIMGIVEKFLQKKQKIEENFSGKSSIQTYIIAILNRMCCELIRKEVKHWKRISVLNENYELFEEKNNFLNLFIADEMKQLDHIMLLFGPEQSKLKLFLAYFFNIPVSTEDIISYSSKHNKVEVQWLLESKRLKTKSQLFSILSNVVNLVEHKTIKPDAVRIWLIKRLDQIVERMNSSSITAYYDRESVQLLFERYCAVDNYTNEHVGCNY